MNKRSTTEVHVRPANICAGCNAPVVEVGDEWLHVWRRDDAACSRRAAHVVALLGEIRELKRENAALLRAVAALS